MNLMYVFTVRAIKDPRLCAGPFAYEQIERSLEASPSHVMADVSGSGPGKVPEVKADMVSLRTETRSPVKAARPSSVGSSMLFMEGMATYRTFGHPTLESIHSLTPGRSVLTGRAPDMSMFSNLGGGAVVDDNVALGGIRKDKLRVVCVNVSLGAVVELRVDDERVACRRMELRISGIIMHARKRSF